MEERTERIAKDLFEFGGRLYSKRMLAKFLGLSWPTVKNILKDAEPCVGQGTSARYYYRDVAEILAKGV